MKQLITAFKAFFLILRGKGENVQPLLLTDDQNNNDAIDLKVNYEFSTNSAIFNNGAMYMLHLLQREGRFIDFLNEDISNYDDAQVGAAVRLIHQNCHKTLEDYFSVEKIITATNEGEIYNLPEKDVDNNIYKLSGNVPNKAPYSGILEHQGWKISSANLPQINDAFDCSVLRAAEINCQ